MTAITIEASLIILQMLNVKEDITKKVNKKSAKCCKRHETSMTFSGMSVGCVLRQCLDRSLDGWFYQVRQKLRTSWESSTSFFRNRGEDFIFDEFFQNVVDFGLTDGQVHGGHS